MLRLRKGIVTTAEAPDGGGQRLEVDHGGLTRPALADVTMVGEAEPGDEVIVNVAALDLGLGSGGFDVVHVNLTRGLGAVQVSDDHVMKLNYTSLQHAISPVEGPELKIPIDRPVAVLALHGQLAGVAFAFEPGPPGRSAGLRADRGRGAAGGHSRTVRTLRERGLLCDFVTAGRGVRRRGRGGDDDRRAAPRADDRGLGRGGLRSGPRHPRLGIGTRPRWDGSAGLGPRRAGARVPGRAVRADVVRATLESATSASRTTRARWRGCCSRG